MTPEQEQTWRELAYRHRALSERLQLIADAVAERAAQSDISDVKRSDEQAFQASSMQAWEETMARIESLTDAQEKLLVEANLLPKRDT